MRRRDFVGLMGVMAASGMLGLPGCASQQQSTSTTSASGKEVVSMALWGNQLLETYAPYLQEQFPSVEFDFYSAVNSAGFYRFRAETTGLPDILTVRRFSLRDVEPLKDQLVDLSDSELANNFYQAYLRSYTYSDGTVNWLPACAEIDDIIINESLFEKYDIPLPTDYESFDAACKQFEKHGIRGYDTDFVSDYTCMETLQGFSAAQLSSAEGNQWRQDYESGTVNELSEEVWLPVFERFVDVAKTIGANKASLDENMFTDVFPKFDKGKLAMYRGTVTNMENWGQKYERALYPYPADDEADNYYLTYPTFQAAASAAGASTDERSELIDQIMTAMFSNDGLNQVLPGQTMVSYNKGVEMNLSSELDLVRQYADENRMFIRLASTDMFSCSQQVVTAYLKGQITTAREMFDLFNELLAEESEAEEASVHIETGYSRLFTPEHGNQAASALMNTIREEMGVELLIGQAATCCGDIPQGDITPTQAAYLVNWESGEARQFTVTGSQLAEYVEWYLNVKNTRDSVINDYTLPVSSGFEMVINKQSDGSYHLDKVTIDGEDVEADREYTLVSWDGFAKNYTDVLPTSGFTDYTSVADDVEVKNYAVARLVDKGEQLSAPTDYITLNET